MQPLHTKSADGTDLLSAAGVLFLAASAAFEKMVQKACAVIPNADLVEIVRKSLAVGSNEE